MAHQLKEMIAKESVAIEGANGEEGKFTLGKLVEDPRMGYLMHTSHRNAAKLLAATSRALQVHIEAPEDYSDFVNTDPANGGHEHAAHSRRAQPEFAQTLSSIQPIEHNGEERVAIFNGVTPSAQCDEHCIVAGAPYDGYHMFKMPNRSTAMALPTIVGRKKFALHKSPKLAKEQLAVVEARAKEGIIWEAGGPADVASVLHPDAHYAIEVEKGKDPYLRAMKSLGWSRKHGVAIMKPVLVKISNPSLERE